MKKGMLTSTIIICSLLLASCGTENKEVSKSSQGTNSEYTVQNTKMDVLGFDLELPQVANTHGDKKINELLFDGVIFEVPYAAGGYSIYEVGELKQWEEAYREQLDKLLQETTDTFEYVLRDLDGNSIPELIVKKQLELTVYTFDTDIKEIGIYDFVTGTTSLFYSDNSAYPGIFYFYESGGLDHYGYMSVGDNKLVVEELWNEDYSGMAEELGIDRNKIEELSQDKELISESKNVYEDSKYLEFRYESISEVYTDAQLIEMAKEYYYCQSGDNPPYIEIDSDIAGIVTLHLYDLNEELGTTATLAWYYIDRSTGKGTDIFDNEIDLNNP